METKFIVGFISLLTAFMQPVQADTLYSVASLTLLCGRGDAPSEFACRTYIHGVIETWMLKDVVDTQPWRFSSQGKRATPAFCEKILHSSEDTWVRIVRSNLNSMQPGFASDAVMNVLSAKLCK